MNNKILSIKRTSAIFLATVLVAGIIALSSPSFMVEAQAVPQYGMEREYGSYEQPEYGSYEQPEYGSYEQPEYGMDSYEKPSYRNDNYEQQPEYPSYKPDYKPEYPSYGKDNNYKSKDSVSIKKLNCINTNFINIGNINGSINTFAPDRTADSEGYLSAGSSGGYGEEGYGNNGYNKQKDKGFTCIINNNINTTIGGGNATTPETITCEECFTENLSVEQLNNLTELLSRSPLVGNLEGLCEQLSNATLTNQQKILGLVFVFSEAGITDEDAFLRILECLEELGLIIVPPNLGLPPDTNTGISSFDINTSGGLASSFSSPPTIAQGTEEDLSALEKITKLKTQWLELLP